MSALQIHLIRHGQTPGNLAGRYIGLTDEGLAVPSLPSGYTVLQADLVFTSPMLRCRQTAELLYPQLETRIVEEFIEYDFGVFENKTYEELQQDEEYRRWIASGGSGAPKNGEDVGAFKKRCCDAFISAVDTTVKKKISAAAFVLHGGVIMAIMEEFCVDRKGFYEWQPKNLGGWSVCAKNPTWSEARLLTDTVLIKGVC